MIVVESIPQAKEESKDPTTLPRGCLPANTDKQMNDSNHKQNQQRRRPLPNPQMAPVTPSSIECACSRRDSLSDTCSISASSLATNDFEDDDDDWVETTHLPPPTPSSRSSSAGDWVECTTLPPVEPQLRRRNNNSNKIVVTSQSLFVSSSPSTTHPPPTAAASNNWWIIPSTHPYKILWDILTVIISLANIYATHCQIKTRTYSLTPFRTVTEAWFILDMILNFFTEREIDNKLVRDGRAIWARYLTSWFVVDLLALFPWESIFVKPIVEMQKKRGFFKKTFFRSRAVMRVLRKLRKNHFSLFGKVARQTKHAGMGSQKLLRMIIKYVPKYLLFLRNMKGAIAVRSLRQIHLIRKLVKDYYAVCSNTAKTTGIKIKRTSKNLRVRLRRFKHVRRRKSKTNKVLEVVKEENAEHIQHSNNAPFSRRHSCDMNNINDGANSKSLPPIQLTPLKDRPRRLHSDSSAPLRTPSTVPFRRHPTNHSAFNYDTPEFTRKATEVNDSYENDSEDEVDEDDLGEEECEEEDAYDSDEENLPF